MLFELAIIAALILANGAFSGAELSVITLRASRLRQLVEEGRAGARGVAALRRDPEGFLATVQVGITVVGATAAAFSGASVARRLSPALERAGLSPELAEDAALAVVVAAISYLTLVFGELVPKSLALRSSERYALLAARPLQALRWVARPVVAALTFTSNLVLRPLGDATSFTESRVSAEELRTMVDEAAQAGTVDAGSGEIASRALEFGTLTAADVMVPRNLIRAIPLRASPDEVRRILLEDGHARMPVYRETLDDVVGYVTTTDVLALEWERDLLVLEDIVRPPVFVPETASAVAVLKDLRVRRLWVAVVVDEHGGVAGLVTLEDLLEELVGELFTEREQPEAAVHEEADGAYLVRAATPVREVNRELGFGLPEGEWSTVAGLAIALAGGIPRVGTRLDLKGGATLEVVDATARLVRTVRLRPPPAGPAPT
ncbi:MAG: hemolysin family protein [Anaeromyxobacteraceae bacterium]